MGKLFNSEIAGGRSSTTPCRSGAGAATRRPSRSRHAARRRSRSSGAALTMRINRIFEGSSEIMRLFIAREAVDPHLKKAGAVADVDAALGDKAKDAVGLGVHMASWVGGTWSVGAAIGTAEYGPLGKHVRFAANARASSHGAMAHAMARFGPKLERKQAVLFRFVDIGAELFAMSAACVRAACPPITTTVLKLGRLSPTPATTVTARRSSSSPTAKRRRSSAWRCRRRRLPVSTRRRRPPWRPLRPPRGSGPEAAPPLLAPPRASRLRLKPGRR
jgi:hypothetical protein